MNADENFHILKRSASGSQGTIAFSDFYKNALLTQHKYPPQDLNNTGVKRAKKAKKKSKKKQKQFNDQMSGKWLESDWL